MYCFKHCHSIAN